MEITIEDYDLLLNQVRALKAMCLQLREIVEGGISANNIHSDAVKEHHVKSGSISADKITLTLDDIQDGVSYGRLLGTSITAGQVLLSQASGNLDDIADGTYGKLLSTSLSSGLALLSACNGDLDDITNGTNYGKVNVTNISAGNIILAQCTGDLDDISNGSTYGKVALTSISAGKIIVAGLDSGITDRMFANLNTKNNIEAWRHASDVTLIDGGDIYANSLTIAKLATDATNKMFGADATKTNVEGWVHASDVTKIDGGDIYTDSITVRKITLDNQGYVKTTGKDNYADTTAGIWFGYDSGYKLNIGNATKWLKWNGSALYIHGKLYVGGGTDEDIYFEDSGIRLFDYNSTLSNALVFAKSGLTSAFINLVSTAIVFGAIGGSRAEFYADDKIILNCVSNAFYFHTTGQIQLPALTSDPTSNNANGQIAWVNGILRIYNGGWSNV